MKMNVVLFLQLFLFVEGVSGFINSPASLPTANRALASTANAVVLPKNDLNSLTSAELESMRLEGAAALASTTNAVDLQSELEAAGLGVCTGPLHAIGVRCLADLKSLTSAQLESMRLVGAADPFDYKTLLKFVDTYEGEGDDVVTTKPNKLSTSIDGAFDRPPRGRFEPETPIDFDFKVIDDDIFVGQLFTAEQCGQLNRMAEYHCYRGVGTMGSGWTNTVYTLTAQHLQCKFIPGMVQTTKPIFDQLIRAIYDLYPGRIRPGSIVFENDGEPHLVKYNGKAKGTQLHTDNSEFVYITVNVMLSEPTDFSGGGTYITTIDKTIQLKEGEMLIHLGDVEHAGAEITSGVRRILIAFLACEWMDESLNIEKTDQSREKMSHTQT